MTAKVAFQLEGIDGDFIEFHPEDHLAKLIDEWGIVKRLPNFDQYGHQYNIPAQAYFDNGWAIVCSNCDKEFDENLWDEDEEIDIEPVFDGLEGFCSKTCHQKWNRDRVQHKHITQQIKACIRSTYPDADFTYVSCDYARFRLPGLTRSAWWLFEDGEGKYFFWLGDRDNHENYLKERDRNGGSKKRLRGVQRLANMD